MGRLLRCLHNCFYSTAVVAPRGAYRRGQGLPRSLPRYAGVGSLGRSVRGRDGVGLLGVDVQLKLTKSGSNVLRGKDRDRVALALFRR